LRQSETKPHITMANGRMMQVSDLPQICEGEFS